MLLRVLKIVHDSPILEMNFKSLRYVPIRTRANTAADQSKNEELSMVSP